MYQDQENLRCGCNGRLDRRFFPKSIQSPDNIYEFKKNSGHNRAFMKTWYEALDDVLEDQAITLDVLMSAEMVRERAKSDNLTKWAEILRNPKSR